MDVTIYYVDGTITKLEDLDNAVYDDQSKMFILVDSRVTTYIPREQVMIFKKRA